MRRLDKAPLSYFFFLLCERFVFLYEDPHAHVVDERFSLSLPRAVSTGRSVPTIPPPLCRHKQVVRRVARLSFMSSSSSFLSLRGVDREKKSRRGASFSIFFASNRRWCRVGGIRIFVIKVKRETKPSQIPPPHLHSRGARTTPPPTRERREKVEERERARHPTSQCI